MDGRARHVIRGSWVSLSDGPPRRACRPLRTDVALSLPDLVANSAVPPSRHTLRSGHLPSPGYASGRHCALCAVRRPGALLLSSVWLGCSVCGGRWDADGPASRWAGRRPWSRPGVHGYVAAQAPWHTITDALPRFATAPPSVVACPPPPVQYQTGLWQTACARGSCLCGGVVYEVSGTLEVIKNCHCWRDRKMTGAPHDSCLAGGRRRGALAQGEGPCWSSTVSLKRQDFGRAFVGYAAPVCRLWCPTPRRSAFRRAPSTTIPEPVPGIISSVAQKRRGSRLPTTCRNLRSILLQGSISDKVASWSEGGSPSKDVNNNARRN